MQTLSEVKIELAGWYKARAAAQLGKTLTIQTGNGVLRTVSRHDLKEVQIVIDRLEKIVANSGRQPFSVANFNC